MAIRLYLSALTLVFLIAASVTRGLGSLEASVVICALIYLILDARENLRLVQRDVSTLEDVEKRISQVLH